MMTSLISDLDLSSHGVKYQLQSLFYLTFGLFSLVSI